jgi:Concanavalin A-like lectin/glucanases superfamily
VKTYRRAVRVTAGFAVAVLGSVGFLAVVPQSAGAATKPATSACGTATGTYYKEVMSLHPLAYYRLDESAGLTACDDSGNGNSGTYAASGVDYGVPGALKNSTDTAISAEGGANPVTVDSSSLPTGSPAFTMEGWFSTTSTQDQMLVDMGTNADTDGVVGLGVWNSDSLLYIDMFRDDVNFPIPSKKVLSDGKWYFIAVTHSAKGKVVGYLDGKSLGSVTHGALDLQGQELRIGWWVDTVYNQPFIGSMDEVAVFPKALSATQVAAEYSAGR